jgi:hypothetical protein
MSKRRAPAADAPFTSARTVPSASTWIVIVLTKRFAVEP